MKYLIMSFVMLSYIIATCKADIYINEVMPSNYYSIYDEDYNASDWIEIYNSSDQEVNLKDYAISDKSDYTKSYKFPNIIIAAKSYLTIFADDKNRSNTQLQIIENTSNGIWHGGIEDDFTFLYQPISGDFTAELDVRSIREFDHQSMTGIILRAGLDNNDAYAGIFCKAPGYDGFISQYRSEKGVNTIYTFPDFGIDYPNEKIKLERIGDSVFTYFLRGGAFWILHRTSYLPSSTPLYFGVTASSSNIYLKTIFAINSLKINDSIVKLTDLIKAEIGTSSSKLYTSNEIHTNFKLKTAGESVYLWDNTGKQIDNFQIPQMRCDVSYGRFPDGGTEKYFFKPATPNYANNNKFVAFAKSPSIESSKFWNDNVISVKIMNNEPDSKIYYTTNGSLPTDTAQIYMNEDITIDKNKVIKAICIKDNYINSKVETSSFFYRDSSSLPVISISSDSLNFWDPNDGIFIQKNMYSKREILSTFEIFDRNKRLAYKADCGIKLHGNVTRGFPQKALRFYARRLYETDEFTYPFFDGRSLPAYETFIIRNSGNDWKDAYFRDALMAIACENIQNFDVIEYQPCLAFINGYYWGLYNFRERLDEEYLANKYNISDTSINLIESNDGVIAGSIKPFIEMQDSIEKLDMTQNSNFKYAEDNIDIDWFIDYSFANIYAFNYDWPWNNIKVWQSSELDNKWRWVLFDLDFGLGWMGSVPWGNYLPAAFKNDTCRYGNIAYKLLQNEGFKIKFINRSCDLINTDFHSDRMVRLTDSVANQIKPEIDRQHEKWSESVEYWTDKVNSIRYWVDNRDDSLPNNYVDYFKLDGKVKTNISINKSNAGSIKLNSIYLKKFPWNGVYMQGVPIDLTVYPNSGSEFKYWVIDGIQYNENPLKLILNDTVSLIQAVFENGEIKKNIVINEIMYKSSPIANSGDWVELYNPADSSVDVSAYVLKDSDNGHNFVIPQSTSIAAHSYLVICENLTSFKTIYPLVNCGIGNLTYALGKEDAVRLYDASLKLVDSVSYTSSDPWYEACYGTGPSLELNDCETDNTLAFNWSPSKINNGTPGASNSSTVSVEDHINNSQIRIYPNPTKETAFIEFNSDSDYQINIEIIDILANIYFNDSQFINSGINKIALETNNLSSGAYFVKIKFIHNNFEFVKLLPLLKK